MLEALVAKISNSVCHAVRALAPAINRKPWFLPVAIIAAVFLVW